MRKYGQNKLYILDDLTTGLYLADIQRLLDCLNSLVNAGHSVIVVEQNLEVIKTADWVIDLGSDGGENGGYLIDEVKPEDLARVEASFTGQHLKRILRGSL